jgi:flagella basal body P-ring formation protein FlgA
MRHALDICRGGTKIVDAGLRRHDGGWVVGLVLLLMPWVAQAAATEAPGDVAAAVRQAAVAITPPGGTISLGTVQGAVFMPVCTVPLAVTISGEAPYQQAAARCATPGWTLYVSVTVQETAQVAVAAHPIAPGQVIGPADIVMAREPVQNFAGRQVFYDPALLPGVVAALALPAGTIFDVGNIQQPVIVKAGQTVTVIVICGGARLSINAVADETGRVGDTILLTNRSSGRRFSATVTASGPVLDLRA